MDTVKSFRGYGKVDELEQASFKRKTRKRLIILTVSVVLLLALVVGIVAGALAHRSKSSGGDVPASQTSPSAALRSICTVTQYPDSCYTSLGSSNTTDPQKVFRYSLTILMSSLKEVSNLPDEYVNKTDDPRVKEALNVCGTVLDDAVETLNDTMASDDVDELKTWLSTVITDQETCLDTLVEANATFVDEVKNVLRNSTEFASNSLAIVSRVVSLFDKFKKKIIPNTNNRRLLTEEDHFPSWVTAGDRRLLQQANPKPDVTVAGDGSGDVKTINEAVARIPKKSNTRFVIYVKSGTYTEKVVLDKSKTNVMIYGDGKDATIISGSKNFVDGRTPTFETATFAVVGKGFIARDIGFKNTAGPTKHQAVAFRSGSDQSVYFSCSFDAFQDTLYAHSNRQFYRNCDITGTIDFIFGNSAVVFQNCNIRPRQPLSNQFVTITAQGKKDPNQNTGISIQRCTMSPLDNLTAPTYLGRPWKEYSTTVIMQSDIGGFLNPLGWAPWVSNVDPPSTIFYGEYQNSGPGSSTSGRVKWAGLRPNMTPAQASQFNVQSFIQGPAWLPDTRVTFDST